MSTVATECRSRQRPLSVFISYAHEDEMFRRELDTHLAFLRRSGQISTWHDRKLAPGEAWDACIHEQLDQADIILLLLSPDFADSEYCWGVETKRALERHDRGEAILIPVLIRPTAGWEDTPLGRLLALPREAKPVSQWASADEAYHNIADGLRELISAESREITYSEPQWCDWHLTLEGSPDDYPQSCVQAIVAKLSKAANSEKLELLRILPGSARLELRSTQDVLDSLLKLHDTDTLASILGVEIIEMAPGPGAVLRIESRIVNGDYNSTIRYMPELFGGRPLEDGFPPLVGGIEFPLNDPMKIGFSLLADAEHDMPTPTEQLELQRRLGSYLNTSLVLTGDQLNVSLSPVDEYCGLPELLRRTELGRDMLAQDVVLKHYTASQLHPSTPHGSAFWRETSRLTSDHRSVEACFRVWIVPDAAEVRESSTANVGSVKLEKLGLKVLCEGDYDTLQRCGGSRSTGARVTQSAGHHTEITELFKEHVLPRIQKEVSCGHRFGLLRQILSVLLVAKWIESSQIGKALTEAGFINSNDPDKYGLSTVADGVLLSMKRVYLQLFASGVWRHVMKNIDVESGLVAKRLYVAGGIAAYPKSCDVLDWWP